MSESPTPSPRRWRAFFVSWALFGALMGLWTIATPIGAAPDEPAHIIKAASVARGEFIGEPGSYGHVVQVPRYVADTHALTCFAFDPTVSADCPLPKPGDPAELVDGTTTAGLYNPVYYALIGWPSLVFGDSTGIYAMRGVSALLTSGILALAVMLIAGWRRRALPTLGLLAATTPMLLFLGGVVNPSAPEVAGVVTATIAILSIALRQDPSAVRLQSIVMAVSGSIAISMRGISPLWVALALALPLVLVGWRGILDLLKRPAIRVAVVVIAAVAASAVFWTMISNSLGAAITTDDDVATRFPGVGTHPIAGFGQMLLSTFDFARGMIGEFGWADTSATAFTFFLWSAFAGILMLIGLVTLRGRALIVLIGFIAATLLLPAGVQAMYVTSGGYIWQGRYTLPIFAALLVAAAALIDDAIGERIEQRVLRRLVALVAAAWAVAQFDSFLRVLRRYAEGLPSGWGEFLLRPDWSPPGGTILLPACYAAALLVAAFVAYRWTTRPVAATDRLAATR